MGQFRSLIDADEVRELCERAGLVEPDAIDEPAATRAGRIPGAPVLAQRTLGALRSGVQWAVGTEDTAARGTSVAEGPSGLFSTLPSVEETFSELLANVLRTVDGRAALLVDDVGSAIAMLGRADDVEAISAVIGWARTLRGTESPDPYSAAVSLDATSVVQVVGLRGAAPAAQLGVLGADYLPAPLVARLRRTVETSVPRIALQPAGAAWSDAALRATPWLEAVLLRDATGRRLRTWSRESEQIDEVMQRCEELLVSCEDVLRMIEATDERQRVVVESDIRMIVVGVTRAADRGVFVFDGAVPPALARLTTAALLARPPQLAAAAFRDGAAEPTRPRLVSPLLASEKVAAENVEPTPGTAAPPRAATPTELAAAVETGSRRDAAPTADAPAVPVSTEVSDFETRNSTDIAASSSPGEMRLLAPIVHRILQVAADPDLALARIALRARATVPASQWHDPRSRADADLFERIELAAEQLLPGYRRETRSDA